MTYFRSLHNEGFIMPNAWDAASARILELAGFAAIGTTSAGIAHAQGKRDGQTLTCQEMCSAVEQIVSAVDLPVNADIEAGYADEPATVANNARMFAQLGVQGLNLEDATGRPQQPLYTLNEQCRRLEAIRRSAPQVFLTARTDTFLLSWGNDENERVEETLRRCRAYLAAGADAVFIPLLTESHIQLLQAELQAPVCVMAHPASPTALTLLSAGASRVSFGQSLMLATLGLVAIMAEELRQGGQSQSMAHFFYGFERAHTLFDDDRKPKSVGE